MRKLKLFYLIIILLGCNKSRSQAKADENPNPKIITVIENYFALEREAVHLHLDKTTFINNESVWFQGYIINRKTHKPFFTSNIYILLLDENGKLLSEKLVYANSGVFSGKMDLGSKLKSGNYYIQAYTNWMNNFSEDESTVTKINVINPSEGLKNYSKINSESLAIVLNPEGKRLIKDISNVVGIRLKDCRGNSPQNLEALIQNSNGETLKSIQLNRFGYGKFEITPTDEKIKVVVKYDSKVIESILPPSDLMGLSVAVNSYSIENKTAVKIKTNATGYNVLKSKKLNVIINQDGNFAILPLQLNPITLEQTLMINNKDLQDGINVIRVIDNDLKQWCERLIYINPAVEGNFTINKDNTHNNKINIAGQSGYANAIVSVSVLPEKTQSFSQDNSIIAGIKINPYLNEPLSNADYYLSSQSRSGSYELDLALLNEQQFKYNWDLMKISHPSSNYSFDMGINLKGSVNTAIKDKDYHKVKLVSFSNLIMMTTDVDKNGDYLFEHMLIEDSSYVNMSLLKLPKFEAVTNSFKPQVLNRKKPFYKPFRFKIPEDCGTSGGQDYITNLDIPKLSDKTIQLKEIEVQNDFKKKLVYQSKIGNSFLKGFKIEEGMTRDLFSFLRSNGFDVRDSMGSITIYSGGSVSITGAPAVPEIYIDDFRIFSPDELMGMSMSEIDEIFLDKRAIVPGLNNKQGIIKIYRKKNFDTYKSKKDPNSFYFTEGFSRDVPFKNVDYDNTQDLGFDNFGLINWSPGIQTDESGNFVFETTDYNKTKCKIIVEGMTSDGKLFHEEQTVELK